MALDGEVVLVQHRLTNFNQGVVHFGTIKTKRNANREKIGFEFNKAGLLFFNYRQIRVEDQDYFKVAKDSMANLKIETYYYNSIDKESHKAVINGDYYEITAIDPSNDRKTMFWYLVKKGALNALY